MNYLFHVLVMASLYSILAMSLNLVVGYTGLLSLCHAAFYGIGAYASTLLVIKGQWPFPAAVAGAIAFTVLVSLVIAAPSLRLRGDYFVLCTLGFQVIVFSVLYNWSGLTNGSFGIAGIPVPHVLGVPLDSPARYGLFSLVVAIACGAAVWRLTASPFGRLLKAIREDELAAAALGKNVTAVKTTSFVLGAAVAAVPGALFAGYARYIDPTSFTLTESISILSMVIIGGAGSFPGPIIGAVFVVMLPEALRFLEMPMSVAANLRQIIYGLLLIGLMRVRPQGLFGDYEFD